MSLFGFGDIKFNNNQREGFGPLAALEDKGGEFKRDSFRYPIDVGSFDKGHYMVFYIREQKKTTIAAGANPDANETPSSIPSNLTNIQNISTGSEITNKLASGINQIKSSINGLGLNDVGSQLSNLSSGVGGGISGQVGSLLNKAGSSVKSGLQNIFGQSNNILQGNTQSTNTILDTNIKRISNTRLINTTRLTKETIALYMPDTLMYNHTQNYDQAQLGLAGQIATVGKSALKAFQDNPKDKGTLDAVIKAGSDIMQTTFEGLAVGATQNLAGSLGGGDDVGRALSLATLGKVMNPMLEMVYQSPNFRTFQFDFMFYPRDEQEALEVQNIIDRFKYHQAPEYGGDGESRNLTLRPPSEFDIKFYYGAGENPNIPGVAPGCVLTTIDVNYAPNGWSAYEVPGENIASLGRTGMPTAIQLTLQFTETTILTKNDLRNPGTKNRSNANAVPGQRAISPSGTIGPGL